MIKQLTGYLEYGLFAEISVAIFAVIFIAIIIRTLMTKSDVTSQQAQIVLGERKEETA